MGGIISGIISAIVTGVASAWLSLFQFRAQHEWQRKQEAFKDVLLALHEMRITNEQEYRAMTGNRELAPDRLQELHRRWRDATAVIERYADIGSVMLSKNAESVLQTFRTDLNNAGRTQSYGESLDGYAQAVIFALDAIKRQQLLSVGAC